MFDTAAISDQLQELYQAYRQEHERNRRDHDEIERLVRQAQTEVEKLAQRELNAASQLRNLQANLDRFSKEDIRNVFALVHEVQMRLLSARAQVEQLQSKQRRLAQRQEELTSLLVFLEQVAEFFRHQAQDVPSDSQTADVLIGEVMEAQEQERLRISLQMHDGPTQKLSNLILHAEICERLVDRDVQRARSELTELRQAIHATLQETRQFTFELRPMILDDLGLVPTLRRYAHDFGAKSGLSISVTVQNIENRLPRHYEVALFRFVQETLNNVVRHANAATARVSLDVIGSQLQLLVEDDGDGFNVADALSERPGRRAMGFAVMRQQVETLLQGKLQIESMPGQGSRVVATIPLGDSAVPV